MSDNSTLLFSLPCPCLKYRLLPSPIVLDQILFFFLLTSVGNKQSVLYLVLTIEMQSFTTTSPPSLPQGILVTPKPPMLMLSIGKTNINSVEFLVFAENARLREDGETGARNLRTQLKTAERIKAAVERDSGRSEPMDERVDVVADKMCGKELLEKWAEDKDSFTFDTHLKDLFDVITSLGNEASLFTFQCFIYRRAYRKVAWRVLEISTHWGTSPFGLIKQCLHQPNLLCKEVDIQLPTQFHKKLQETLELKNHSIPNTDSGDLSIVKYPVNSNNAKSWLSIIYKQWLELEVHLLVDKKATETTAGKEGHQERSSSPMLDHLLSVEGLHKVLADAAESEDSEDHDELNLTQKEVDSAQLYPSYATSRLMSAFKNHRILEELSNSPDSTILMDWSLQYSIPRQ
ncbi:hypothetical protein BT96DRAFT_946960 [Gymnopus androsaceus JB14]|uniref:Uncharacterized protein n=1 Tax=Gymnopus androsaceus JB14 TaxID=1447944 RepID=A0A6A4GTZ2_9AGAR|nr:hypothetical protein BT96DRAFT_946960 [Gymnopus androsaceus JB14]